MVTQKPPIPPIVRTSFRKRLNAAHRRPIHRQNVVDDGFFSPMAKGAVFNGIFEIPSIHGPSSCEAPLGMIPFTKMCYSAHHEECVVFFEKDPLFADVLVAADEFIDDLRQFPFVLSPDCSLYRDMPLCLQIANVYMSRLVGYYFETKGLTVIPTVRWGDERSYTTTLFPEKFAFSGIRQKSIVAIGTYGCIQGFANQRYFKEGLESMLKALRPRMVLVYGAMPPAVFQDYERITTFVHYPDWISLRHGSHG